MFEYGGLKISWLGHDGFKIKNSLVVYTDPFQINPDEKADLVLVSHEHYDHCSPQDLKKILGPDTTIVTIHMAEPELARLKPGEVKLVKPGDKFTVKGVKIEVYPAYNIDKFRSPGVPFHPREDGKASFLFEVDGVRLYHAGDSDFIPEMEGIEADIAFLPVSGTYVMTAEEAVKAAEHMKIKLAIPMHYGAIVGSREDALKFKQKAPCEVAVLEKE